MSPSLLAGRHIDVTQLGESPLPSSAFLRRRLRWATLISETDAATPIRPKRTHPIKRRPLHRLP